jgi:hypothetical protein
MSEHWLIVTGLAKGIVPGSNLSTIKTQREILAEDLAEAGYECEEIKETLEKWEADVDNQQLNVTSAVNVDAVSVDALNVDAEKVEAVNVDAGKVNAVSESVVVALAETPHPRPKRGRAAASQAQRNSPAKVSPY